MRGKKATLIGLQQKREKELERSVVTENCLIFFTRSFASLFCSLLNLFVAILNEDYCI